MGWAAVCIVPLYVWIFLVKEPLTAADPLNWRLLFSGVKIEKSDWFALATSGFGRRYNTGVVLGFFFLATMPIMFRHPIVIIVNTLLNFVRFKRLPAQVRTAVASLASTPVTPKESADTMPSNTAVSAAEEEVSIVFDYQPLNKRPPTREILSPFASHFEALLALPGMATVKVVVRPRASHTCYSSTHNP